MAKDHSTSVIQRKANAERSVPEIAPITSGTAFRMALIHAGQDVAALNVMPATIDETRETLKVLESTIAENSLLALVEGANSAFGLVILDTQLLAALIEIQTTGRVSSAEAPARQPTRTDAIMSADFVDRVLELFERNAHEADLDIAAAVSGYRFAVPLDDLRAANLALLDQPYRLIRAELDLASGAKTGVLQFLLPFGVAQPKVKQKTHGPSDIEKIASTVEVQMQAILHRFSMSVENLMQLEVGMKIPVPSEKLGMVGLRDTNERDVATCRLGQNGGFRAVRIGADTSEKPLDLDEAASLIIAANPDIAQQPPEKDELSAFVSEFSTPEIGNPADENALLATADAAPLLDISDLSINPDMTQEEFEPLPSIALS